MTADAFFRVENLVVHYHKVAALRGISLQFGQGDIVTLIGANGAGKSTTLRAISGLAKPTSGGIWFEGTRIDGLPAPRIVAMGIAHVPEGRRVFPDLTVYENLRTGAYLRRDRTGVTRDLDEVYAHFPRLAERRSQLGKTLSGGEQQMLAIGRALMARPRLLMLDEPSLGLSPVLVKEIGRIVVEIHQRGIPVILVEQNAEMALRLAGYGYVLETGKVALHGRARDLHEHEHVKRAYLGA
jgi:branched-chain amino acid transport system ATP-binding protein